MKYYLVERNGQKQIEQRTQAPEIAYVEVPTELAGVDPEAIIIESVTNEFGIEQTRVSVDEAKWYERMAAKEAEQEARDADEKARKDKRAKIKADLAKAKTVADAIAVLKDMHEEIFRP